MNAVNEKKFVFKANAVNEPLKAKQGHQSVAVFACGAGNKRGNSEEIIRSCHTFSRKTVIFLFPISDT